MARSRKCKLPAKKSLRSSSKAPKTRVLKVKKESRPKKEIPASNDPEEDVKCSICLDTTRCRKMKTLYCKHKFHEKCVNTSLERNPYCPLCRSPCGHQKIFEDFSDLEIGPHDQLTNTIMRHMLFFTFQVFDQ